MYTILSLFIISFHFQHPLSLHKHYTLNKSSPLTSHTLSFIIHSNSNHSIHSHLSLSSNNQIRGYSRPIIYWGVYDIPVLTIWAHSLSFLISCSRMFAYNNNFLSPSLWYTRLFIVSIIKG